MESLRQLECRWRKEAEHLRERYGPLGESLAALCGAHARELKEVLRAEEDRVLTLEEAATYSGRGKSTIRRWLDTGQIENAGRKGAPLVRRGDLPLSPQRVDGIALLSEHGVSPGARALLERKEKRAQRTKRG